MRKILIFLIILSILLIGCSKPSQQQIVKETSSNLVVENKSTSTTKYAEQLKSCVNSQNKTQCYALIAAKSKDTGICDLLDTGGRFDCYILVAMVSNDIGICNRLSDKYYCYASMAWKSKNPNICDSLDEKSKSRCHELYDGFVKEETEKNKVSEPKISESGKANLLIYENHGVKIKYPSNWEIEELSFGSQRGAKFWSHHQSISDTFSENLLVVVNPLQQAMTLKEFTDQNIEQIKKVIPNVGILSSNDATLDNNQAHKLVLTYIINQQNLKSLQMWTLKDNKSYVLTYVAEVGEYDTFLETAQEMINSFKIV